MEQQQILNSANSNSVALPVVLDQSLFLLKHPFYQAWVEGTLPLSKLQDYAKQYYHHVQAFPKYLESAIALAPTTEAKSVLTENLQEEDGTLYGTSHPELWLRFAEGTGVKREDAITSAQGPGIQNVVNTFVGFSQSSYAEALGALYAYESQVPEIAHSKIEGLKKHFQIQDERSLSFFEVHKSADLEHREKILELLSALTPIEKQLAQKAADQTCQALWSFLSSVHHTNQCA